VLNHSSFLKRHREGWVVRERERFYISLERKGSEVLLSCQVILEADSNTVLHLACPYLWDSGIEPNLMHTKVTVLLIGTMVA
jgi:hypothetical protein